MAYVPDRGDIVHLHGDATHAHATQFALVVSGRQFNERGLAIACPIAQGHGAEPTHGTVVSLAGAGTRVQGVVYCHQMKSLDWRARHARFKEAVPQVINDEVAARVEAILLS